MTDLLDVTARPPSVVSARRRGHDPDVVVRWVERGRSPLGALPSEADLADLDQQLVGTGVVRLDTPFAPASNGAVDGWRAPGRLLPSRVLPLRPFRIVVEIAPWSPTEIELRISPKSRRALRRWGEWRLRRYWNLAHDVADRMARHLSPRAPRPDAPGRHGDARARSDWDDSSRGPVHPLLLPVDCQPPTNSCGPGVGRRGGQKL